MNDTKPKKIDQIQTTTDKFLHELSNTESIFFEILTERNAHSPFSYGMTQENVAEMAIDIDKYNATNPPAPIVYKIEPFKYNGPTVKEEEEKEEEMDPLKQVQTKIGQLFQPQHLVLSTAQGGNTVLTTEQFKALLTLFTPYFCQSWARGELIQYLYDETKKLKK